MRKIIDISKWNGQIDWDQVEAWGVSLVIMKCSAGIGYLDPEYIPNSNECINRGIPFFSYHFYNAWRDAQGQFQWFKDCVSPHSRRDVLDYEHTAAKTVRRMTLDVLHILSRMQQRGGKRPVIYGSKNGLYNRLDQRLAVKAAADIWLGWPMGADANPVLRYYGLPALYQYNWKGQVPGIDENVDMNLWTGTDAAFAAWIGETTEKASFQDLAWTYQQDLIQRGLTQLGILDADGRPLV